MMLDPMPLNEEGDQQIGSGPDPVDPTTVRTLFSIPAKTNRWLKWIELLLSDVPAAEFIADINDLMALCQQAEAAFSQDANVVNLDVGEGEDLIIVGDTHGQFKDLTSHVLCHQAEARLASKPDYKYLFLGDYVDRGPQSVEVLVLLLALKVEYPDHIHMLRGNHEEFQTCRIYGFSHECSTKFKDPKAFHRFNIVFTALPLAAVVSTKAGKFFCAHGGLSPRLDLVEALQFVNRFEYEGGADPDSGDIIDGLLWSDPTESTQQFSQNTRGCGYLFGLGATKTFLETNHLSFIVRAHQLAMEGYSWEHEHKVLTIFSAPNYCGINNNKGAIFVVHGSQDSFDDLDLRSYDVVSVATPLFANESPQSEPKPDADRVHGSYFESENKEGAEAAQSSEDATAASDSSKEPGATSSEDEREALL